MNGTRTAAKNGARDSALILYGKPASGKGTQGRILDAIPGFVHLAAGRILRSLSDESSKMGQQVRGLIERGELVPDELMIEVFSRHLASTVKRGEYRPGSDVLVLDGIPRTDDQVELLAAHMHMHVELVIHLRCDDDAALLERVRSRARTEDRPDDQIETTRKRLASFERETAPVLDSYPSNIRTEVDALEHPVVVHDGILHALIRRFLEEEGSRHG